MNPLRAFLISLFLASPSPGATNFFSITLDYSGNEMYLPMFQEAKTIWEQIIPSYINGNQGAASFSGITITATIGAMDGPGGVLGSAGPTWGAYDDAGFLLATAGEMEFDQADIDGLGSHFTTVILHEMGHVLGLGSLWTYNNLYVTGSGQYTGAAGLAAYRAEFQQPDATYVPVELNGGPGTADGHWAEVEGGTGMTGLVSVISGSDMAYELMTGWLNTDQPYFISNVTRGSLRDLGYDVALLPVPEPSSLLLAGMVLCLWVFRRRRIFHATAVNALLSGSAGGCTGTGSIRPSAQAVCWRSRN